MRTSDFDYTLPQELIAQVPLDKRDDSRLLVLSKSDGVIEHRKFKDILRFFSEGDVLILNETKVIPARIFGRREDTGGKLEILLLHNEGDGVWNVMVKPGRRAYLRTKFVFGDGELRGEVIGRIEGGGRKMRFNSEGDIERCLEKIGIVPIPPYIRRSPGELDRERYQTVYARVPGAAAAPTAGLHFTYELLKEIENMGVVVLKIILHVGIGTFRPVRTDVISMHKMEKEYYEISDDVVKHISSAKERGKRIFACGTTVVRALETKARGGENKGWTDLFITPSFEFKIVDALITNFHLPRTTLLMLVCAFAGTELVLKAYNEAIKYEYRFYSYGDAMLIL